MAGREYRSIIKLASVKIDYPPTSVCRNKKFGIVEAYAAIVERSSAFASIEARGKAIGMDCESHKIEALRIHQERAIVSHNGVKQLVPDKILALFERYAKAEFGEQAAGGVNVAIVGKSGGVGPENRAEKRAECAR